MLLIVTRERFLRKYFYKGMNRKVIRFLVRVVHQNHEEEKNSPEFLEAGSVFQNPGDLWSLINMVNISARPIQEKILEKSGKKFSGKLSGDYPKKNSGGFSIT